MGMTTISLDKIKLHNDKNEVHKQAQDQELVISSRAQPGWLSAQRQQISKHEQTVQNLMFSCIYLCQQDHSLNSIEPLCVLLEKIGVTLLPAEVSGVAYRNDSAALCFTQHIATCLHEELVEKIKKSGAIGMPIMRYLCLI